MSDVDSLLDELGGQYDAGEGLALSMAIIKAINDEWHSPEADEEKQRRIREWSARLHKGLKTLAERSGASDFSMSVSFPTGVGVTISWETES